MSISSNSRHYINDNYSENNYSNDDAETSTILDYNPNDYYDDASLSSSVQRVLKKYVVKKSNKNHIYKRIITEDGRDKHVKIDFFETTNVQGKYIIDAITGHVCAPHKVGSSDENLYFSTLLATGENGERNAPLLFFDNPQQFERHFHVVVPQGVKEKWLTKTTMARLPLSSNSKR